VVGSGGQSVTDARDEVVTTKMNQATAKSCTGEVEITTSSTALKYVAELATTRSGFLNPGRPRLEDLTQQAIASMKQAAVQMVTQTNSWPRGARVPRCQFQIPAASPTNAQASTRFQRTYVRIALATAGCHQVAAREVPSCPTAIFISRNSGGSHRPGGLTKVQERECGMILQ
jgi:hypothetical protein